MQISLEPGHYVIAVSGGVDSMALLHLLRNHPEVGLKVAHFDHGIRTDSVEDARLVRQMAQDYGLPFVSARAHLGQKASEELARQKRYDFLHRVRQASGARAIVTAHHRDDVLETAIMNIIRGTGRRGLTSLRSTDIVKRPLLATTKAELRAYASSQQLRWREDSTNLEDTYARNYIRHHIVPRFSAMDVQSLHNLITTLYDRNDEIDDLLRDILRSMTTSAGLNRRAFISLPHAIAREIMASWLRQQHIRAFDSTLIERLVHAAKTYQPGKRMHISGTSQLRISKEHLALERLER